MEHAHQLVKVTNFMLHLMLLLPLQTTSSTGSATGGGANPATGNNIAVGSLAAGALGKSSTDFTG
uniref:Uncharacterized protein n=1 Tax=Anopheles dirus TaxID=7168 RepID=A0A182NWI1_9DIPT